VSDYNDRVFWAIVLPLLPAIIGVMALVAGAILALEAAERVFRIGRR